MSRSRAPSGARLLGDDYQHLLTWLYAGQLLRGDPDVISVEMEKHGAGNVDDFVVHRRAGRPEYHQVKFSTRPAGDPLTGAWFLNQDKGKRSPLQRFHDSWITLSDGDVHPRMVLHTNRTPADRDPLLACVSGERNLLVPKLARATARSAAGRARAAWAAHLEMPEDEMLAVLACLEIRSARASLTELRDQCALVMDAAGLLVTPQALDAGMLAVRRWIEGGVERVVAETVAQLVDEQGLRAARRRTTLLIQGIAHDPSPELAEISLDWVDAFEGGDPGARRRPCAGDVWMNRFAPELREAERRLRDRGLVDVRVSGAFRLTIAVFTGSVFSDTAGYTIATAGRSGDAAWTGDITTDGAHAATVLEVVETPLAVGDELAVGLSASADLAADVLAHLDRERTGVARFVDLRVAHPGRQALADADAMRGWASAVSDHLRGLTRTAPSLIHLFVAAPRPAALLLGHQWNRIGPTQLYEELAPGRYLPSFRIDA